MRWVALVAAVALIASSCTAARDTRTFVLRSAEPDVPAAAGQVTDTILRHLEAGRILPKGYPVLGHVATDPDPSDPGVEVMSCTPGSPGEAGETRCILLSKTNDFIRVQPVTWQSAAPVMYRLYIMPRSLFARIDLTKDFVALDAFFPGNAALWQPVDQAIRNAAAELGAKPFYP